MYSEFTCKERVHEQSKNFIAGHEQSNGESDEDSVENSTVIDSERQATTQQKGEDKPFSSQEGSKV